MLGPNLRQRRSTATYTTSLVSRTSPQPHRPRQRIRWRRASCQSAATQSLLRRRNDRLRTAVAMIPFVRKESPWPAKKHLLYFVGWAAGASRMSAPRSSTSRSQSGRRQTPLTGCRRRLGSISRSNKRLARPDDLRFVHFLTLAPRGAGESVGQLLCPKIGHLILPQPPRLVRSLHAIFCLHQ